MSAARWDVKPRVSTGLPRLEGLALQIASVAIFLRSDMLAQASNLMQYMNMFSAYFIFITSTLFATQEEQNKIKLKVD